MDDTSVKKFEELSPVLEYTYVMLTNMVKYLDVYAKDIDAASLSQYQEVKNSLSAALKKFDEMYGVSSDVDADEEDDSDDFETSELPQVSTVAPQSSQVTPPAPTPVSSAPVSDDTDEDEEVDPEVMQKAQEAVDELKSLFADMKKKEEELQQAAEQSAPAPQVPVTAPVVSAPVPSVPSISDATMPLQSSVPVDAPPMPPTPVQLPTPMASQQPVVSATPAKDASEIDSILAELRKLQNKGNGQL